MDIKAQVMRNAAVAQQAAAGPLGCKFCERKRVPILPLRVAVMLNHTVRTNWYPSVPKQDIELTGGEFKYGLRTLRMSYLYVLLDKTIGKGMRLRQRDICVTSMPMKCRKMARWHRCHCAAGRKITISKAASCISITTGTERFGWRSAVMPGVLRC